MNIKFEERSKEILFVIDFILHSIDASQLIHWYKSIMMDLRFVDQMRKIERLKL